MTPGQLTDALTSAFSSVARRLGHGFSSNIYAEALALEMHRLGIAAETQSRVDVFYLQQPVGFFIADLLVAGMVLVEITTEGSGHSPESAEARVLNHLRSSRLEHAALMSFGPQPYIRKLRFDNTHKDRSAYVPGSELTPERED
jgi:GxxExxY protein